MDLSAAQLAILNGSDEPKPTNNDIAPLTDAQGEPAQAQASAPIPPQKPVPQGPAGLTDAQKQILDAPQSANVALNAGQATGTSELDAIPNSPLSVMDRAMMGWLRTPQEQKKFLDAYFPDSKLVKNEDGGQSWAIQAKDGKWYQADPNLHWSKLSGEDNTAAEDRTLSNMAGKVGQTLGEYGIRSYAAASSGAAGVVAGAPFGPIGSAIGGLMFAAGGSAGTEAIDLASRKALTGRTPYGDDPKAVEQQLMASAIFGMADFSFGKALHWGAKGIAKGFGKALGTLVGSEEGKMTARKILGKMGANEGFTEARIMDPAESAKFDAMKISDSEKGLANGGELDKVEDTHFDGLYDDMQSALVREQGEFAKMQANPQVQNARFNNAQLVKEPLNVLINKKTVAADGNLIPAKQGGIYGAGDRKVLGYFKYLSEAEGTENMSYNDIRAEVDKIGTMLNGEIQNPYLKSLLTQTKEAFNESIIKGLGDETGAQYKTLLDKYSTVRETMKDLGDATAGQKKYTFINKLVNQDKRSVARDLIQGLQKAGVPLDNVWSLLRVQSAREAAPLFARVSIPGMKVPLPLPSANQSARLAGRAYGALDQFKEGIAKSLPYTDKTLQFMKSLPPEKFKQLMTNQQLFDQLASQAVSGYIGQKTETQQLLKTAGIPDEP